MSRRAFLKLSAILGLGGLAASYPVFIEPYLVQVNHYPIPIPNLPQAFDGFKICHLTDLHYGFLMPYWFLEYVIRTANGLGCEVIVCTGDYVHKRDTTEQIDVIWPLLSTLEAPYGVYSVLGNHDHWGDTGRSLYWLEKSGQDLHFKQRPIQKDGQVNIPFIGTPVLPVRNKSYNFGLKKTPKGGWVFISKGIGWAVYPVRFNCPPEIAVLELTQV